MLDSAWLAERSIARLREAYNPVSGLFDRQLRGGAWGPTSALESISSTAIALIGLSRAGARPEAVGIDLETARSALLEKARDHRWIGRLGMVVWASAATGGPPVVEVLAPLGLGLADLARITARFQTMEVAWLLSGLAHEAARAPDRAVQAALEEIRNVLLGRHVTASRTFVHATAAARGVRRLRRWIANFADQIYSIQALALGAMVSPDPTALEVARGSAARMTELQGPLGQWWWHYDARDGRVAQAYPVYSVHQLGMAPMALRTLDAVLGSSHDEAISRGRCWPAENELGASLVDDGAGTVWRDIARYEGPVARQTRRLRAILGRAREAPPSPAELRVNRETRPYEWAWYLYVHAIEEGRLPGSTGAPVLF